MSEDRFEQEPKDEDVEAHAGEPADDSADVEAHRRKHLLDELNENDEGDKDDGSEDFELHRRKS